MFERYQGAYTEEMRPFVEAMLHKRVVVKLHVDRDRLVGPPQAGGCD